LSELLERSIELAALEDALARARGTGTGSLVLLSGEAGIGKTSLLRVFRERSDVSTLWGGCDPLFTPRPLAPFLELAETAGGPLAARAADGPTSAELLSVLMQELRRRAPAVLVVEDLHWSDEATLDVVRLLTRRIESLPVLLVLTYRDEAVDRTHPLRVLLGELPAGRHVVRLPLPPLSVEAVELLAAPAGVDASALARRTGGNPFFVTEVLAASGAELPETVRDAVLARAAQLTPVARAMLDAVSIVPSRAELWLLEAFVRGYPDGLEECLAAGMLRPEGAAATRSRGWRSRPRSLRTSGSRCIGRRWQRLRGRPRTVRIRHGSPITPTVRATTRECSATRRKLRSGQLRSVHTARRQNSSRERSVRQSGFPRSGGRRCSSGARTSAT
jgi:hypothetical protein